MAATKTRIPPINRKAASSIAECVCEAIGDGGDVPAKVENAADEWQSGRGTESVWATLYLWAMSNLEGPNVRILNGLWS